MLYKFYFWEIIVNNAYERYNILVQMVKIIRSEYNII